MAEEKTETTVPVTTTLHHPSYYGGSLLRSSLLARSGYGWGGHGYGLGAYSGYGLGAYSGYGHGAYGHGYPGWGYGSRYVPTSTTAPAKVEEKAEVKVEDSVAETLRRSK